MPGEHQTKRGLRCDVIAMVMVAWPVVDIKAWQDNNSGFLEMWPAVTGRVCPACSARALVSHQVRRRSVHVGTARGRRGPQCDVVWTWVQRVRCTACGKTHTLLPAFLAPYQRHPSGTREQAGMEREAGASWRQTLERVGLPGLSTTSVRRWVAAVMVALPAMFAAVVLWRALGEGMAGYGSVRAPGSLGAFGEEVRALLAREVAGWPAGETLAGANWQASRRRRFLVI